MERMVEHDVRAVAVAMTMSPLVSIVVMEANGMPELKINVQMDLKVGVADLLQTLVGFQQASAADSISQDIVHPEPANPQAAHVRSAPNRLIIYDPPGPEMLSTSASPPPPPPPPPSCLQNGRVLLEHRKRAEARRLGTDLGTCALE